VAFGRHGGTDGIGAIVAPHLLTLSLRWRLPVKWNVNRDLIPLLNPIAVAINASGRLTNDGLTMALPDSQRPILDRLV
jgi:hypothetical protein